MASKYIQLKTTLCASILTIENSPRTEVTMRFLDWLFVYWFTWHWCRIGRKTGVDLETCRRSAENVIRALRKMD